MFINATSPGRPAVATITGGPPRLLASTSRTARAVMRAVISGLVMVRADAMPSVKGHWATAAAMPGSRAAVAIT